VEEEEVSVTESEDEVFNDMQDDDPSDDGVREGREPVYISSGTRSRPIIL
jgi:hypothetical protein